MMAKLKDMLAQKEPGVSADKQPLFVDEVDMMMK